MLELFKIIWLANETTAVNHKLDLAKLSLSSCFRENDVQSSLFAHGWRNINELSRQSSGDRSLTHSFDSD